MKNKNKKIVNVELGKVLFNLFKYRLEKERPYKLNSFEENLIKKLFNEYGYLYNNVNEIRVIDYFIENFYFIYKKENPEEYNSLKETAFEIEEVLEDLQDIYDFENYKLKDLGLEMEGRDFYIKNDDDTVALVVD